MKDDRERLAAFREDRDKLAMTRRAQGGFAGDVLVGMTWAIGRIEALEAAGFRAEVERVRRENSERMRDALRTGDAERAEAMGAVEALCEHLLAFGDPT